MCGVRKLRLLRIPLHAALSAARRCALNILRILSLQMSDDKDKLAERIRTAIVAEVRTFSPWKKLIQELCLENDCDLNKLVSALSTSLLIHLLAKPVHSLTFKMRTAAQLLWTNLASWTL